LDSANSLLFPSQLRVAIVVGLSFHFSLLVQHSVERFASFLQAFRL
jgi:hypothetical protein